MSITVSNCNEICKSPTNTSKSKMLYSFSKADRFGSTHTTMYTLFLKQDAPSFIKLNITGPSVPPLSVMATNTILLQSNYSKYIELLCHRLPINTIASQILKKVQKKGSDLDVEEWRCK